MRNPKPAKGGGSTAPFHLVLSEPDDVTALWVCRTLKLQSPVAFVTPAELFMAPHWSHDPLGASSVRLASGTIIEDGSVLSVFNRVRHVSPLQFATSNPADQTYASEELFALVISWLTGFGARCVNPPHPGSVAGFAARSLNEDRLRFGAEVKASSRSRHLGLGAPFCGFPDRSDALHPGGPAQIQRDTDSRRILVAGDAMSAPIPGPLDTQLRAEMIRRNLSVAEVTLADTHSGMQITSLNPLPDAQGAEDVDMIAGHLLAVAERERRVA